MPIDEKKSKDAKITANATKTTAPTTTTANPAGKQENIKKALTEAGAEVEIK